MTIAVTSITKKQAFINTLMLQPTYKCALNCKGCYIKTNESLHERTNIELYSEYNKIAPDSSGLMVDKATWKTLEQLFDGRINANQVTLAVDTLPNENNMDRLIMLDTFIAYMLFIYQAREGKAISKYIENTKFHITIHNLIDLTYYIGLASARLSTTELARFETALYSYLDVVSCSSMTDLHLFFLSSLKRINYNTQKYRSYPKWNQLLMTHSGLTINYILHKPPLGEEISANTLAEFYINTLKIKDLQNKYPNRIFIDECFQAGLKSLNSNSTCSAGISNFHQWPGGVISGCPYDSKEVHFDTDIRNIHYRAKKDHPFNYCSIQKVMKENREYFTDEPMSIKDHHLKQTDTEKRSTESTRLHVLNIID